MLTGVAGTLAVAVCAVVVVASVALRPASTLSQLLGAD
jgi:hypothetical protein